MEFYLVIAEGNFYSWEWQKIFFMALHLHLFMNDRLSCRLELVNVYIGTLPGQVRKRRDWFNVDMCKIYYMPCDSRTIIF